MHPISEPSRPGIQNIFLVRHGQSTANLDLSVYQSVADHAVPLSELGHKQAIEAGHVLRELLKRQGCGPDEPVRLWTSPYRRTQQTAQAIAEVLSPSHPGLGVLEHINLCEQQFGLFDGIPDEELANRFPQEHAHYRRAEQHEGRFWARMPLGESRFDVAVRVHQAFGTFRRDAERHGIRNLVVVCHGVAMRAFAMQWLHLPLQWFEQQPNPGNADVYRIDCGKKGLAALSHFSRTPG